MITIVVSGTRHGSSDPSELERVLLGTLKEEAKKDVTLVHGGCQGVDTQCARIATKWGWKVVQVDANWNLHGKAAGPKRNKRMLVEYEPDFIVCFPHGSLASRGTESMLKLAETHVKRYPECQVVRHPVH